MTRRYVACRMCKHAAVETVVFQAWMMRPPAERPTVTHPLCASHKPGLTALMVEAGWQVTAVIDGAVVANA